MNRACALDYAPVAMYSACKRTCQALTNRHDIEAGSTCDTREMAQLSHIST